MSSKELSNRNNNHTENNDDPFTLIEKGNSFELSKNQWGSSDYYSQAYLVLHQEYKSMMMANQVQNNNDNKIDIKRRKVAALYHDQSIEYLHKARQSFIRALMFEREEDLKRWSDVDPMVDSVQCNTKNSGNLDGAFDPIMMVLTKEEMKRRIDTFYRLFVSKWMEVNFMDHDNVVMNSSRIKTKEGQDVEVQTQSLVEEDSSENNDEDGRIFEDNQLGTTCADTGATSLEDRLAMLAPITTTSSENDNTYNDKSETVNDRIELTLEKRLANLNSSIKHTNKQEIPKSDEERLDNIKSSLDNLDVYLPPLSYGKAKSKLLDEHSFTDEDQFNEIMNMAKDEAALDKLQNCDGSNIDDEDVENLLKRSGIRLDLPLHYENDEMIGARDAYENKDILFSSITSLRKAGCVREDNVDDTEGESDNVHIFNLEDMKRVLSKSQQMLLQASVCLDECEDVDMFLAFEKKHILVESNKRHGLDDYQEVSEKEKFDGLADDNDDPLLYENKDNIHMNNESNNDEVVNEIRDCKQNNEGKEWIGNIQNDYKNNGTYNNDDTDPQLLTADNKEYEIESTKRPANTIATSKSKVDTEQNRIYSLGRESLIKAKVYLDLLLEAWPEAEVNRKKKNPT